jgi:hypothetical protein
VDFEAKGGVLGVSRVIFEQNGAIFDAIYGLLFALDE